MHDKSLQRRRYTRRLRNACRSALSAVVLALYVLPASAQYYANGLATDSIDPDRDAVVIAEMRKHMDQIHSEQHRSTVGLVLSGGGAKGAAHVGVLKYLKEQEIPVDAIFGTSMGGLVGGLTALGYGPEYLDSLLRAQDWSVMLTDKIDPSYYSFARKKYRETYLVSIPFHYAKKDFQSRIDDQVRYSDSGKNDEFGTNSFMSSMPSGYVYGFNVNNLFSSLSVGYQDNISFSKLPLPFFCVAADMVSLKSKNWSNGSLKTAMRSTMSIPGMFKPVRTAGMVLVDGGVRNNFPVDLAKAMGCDIIIGVDLSDKDLSYSQVNNLLDIVMQFVTMLGRESMEQNLGAADVFIKPVLDGYNMLSFTPVAIDTMIQRGYVAAQSKAAELAEIKQMTKDAKPYLNSAPAIDINHTPVQIGVVEFKGLTNAESRILQREIKFKVGSYVDRTEMERIMSVIEATGCFSTVTYSILGAEPPYRLIFDCEKGPRHQFGAGVRFDTEEWASFIFNLGFNTHKLNGLKFNIDAEIGRVQMLSAHAALDVSWLPTLNVDASLRNVSSSMLTEFGKPTMETRWGGHRERIYLSNIKWKKVDFKMGSQFRYSALSPKSTYGFDQYDTHPELLSGGYLGFFGSGTLYTMDRSYYPSRGVKLTFGGEYDFLKMYEPGFSPIMTGFLNLNAVIPLGSHFALVPDFHVRAVLNGDFSPASMVPGARGYSISHMNYVGGAIPDRYIDGQIPFIGFGNVYQAQPMVGVVNLGIRARIGRDFFITATGGYFNEAASYTEFADLKYLISPSMLGAGVEFAYVTKAGPLKFLGTWSPQVGNFAQDAGYYISFGFDF